MWIVFLEDLFKPKRCALIFILSGLMGSLLAIAVDKDNEIIMGASAGLYGFYGAICSYIIYNWEKMDHDKNPRFEYFFEFLMIYKILNLF
jgi:membrane associated rhomboid family serine protease